MMNFKTDEVKNDDKGMFQSIRTQVEDELKWLEKHIN